MAERTGLEPATPGVTGRYSNQLNYHSQMVGATGVEPVTFMKIQKILMLPPKSLI